MRSLRVVAPLVIVIAAIVLVWSTLVTSSARISATTSTGGAFSAGTVVLSTPSTTAELLFDTDGMYPGLDVRGCVEIIYEGSIPAEVRLHASGNGGTGLEDFIDFIAVLETSRAGCEGTSGDSFYNGPLGELWARHPTFVDGLVLRRSIEPGERFFVRAVATLDDDDAAQGLTTRFTILVEARP